MPVFPLAALTFSVALAVTLLVTPLVIRLSSSRLLALDRPDTRKFHLGAVPRLGGTAVLAGFVAGIALPLWVSGYSGSLFGAVRYHWIGWIGAIAVLFVCGVVDDVMGLGAATKLLAQVAAGILVYAAGFRIDFIRLPGEGAISLGWLGLPITLLWVVAVTNAINLIDGLDGLAAGMGLMITGTIVAIAYYQGVFPVMVISLALAGSLLGFLPYNFSPARIFLGDSGSQFLGLTLAVVSIRGLQKSATAVAILAPILVLGLPILDTILVVLRRTWRIHGEPSAAAGFSDRLRRSRAVFEADREHIHHNLLDLGLSHRKAVLVLYCAAAVFCTGAFALVAVRNPSLAIILCGTVSLATALVKLLAVRRRGETRRTKEMQTRAAEASAPTVASEQRSKAVEGGGGC